MNKNKIRKETRDGLIYGLIIGLIIGLMLTFITQLIALLTSNPEFQMFDLVVSGILILVIQVIVVIQVISWYYIKKLNEEND